MTTTVYVTRTITQTVAVELSDEQMAIIGNDPANLEGQPDIAGQIADMAYFDFSSRVQTIGLHIHDEDESFTLDVYGD